VRGGFFYWFFLSEFVVFFSFFDLFIGLFLIFIGTFLFLIIKVSYPLLILTMKIFWLRWGTSGGRSLMFSVDEIHKVEGR
jgi:hypothetical protein